MILAKVEVGLAGKFVVLEQFVEEVASFGSGIKRPERRYRVVAFDGYESQEWILPVRSAAMLKFASECERLYQI